MDTFCPNDYDELFKHYKRVKSELNELKQQFYESSRQLKVNETLLTEYQNDIEVLQSREQSINEKFEAKIASLEETIASLRSHHLENISYLETELEKKEKENEELRNQIEIYKKKDSVETLADDSTNLNEINNLTNENDFLKDHIKELEQAFEKLQSQQSEMVGTLEQYKEELSQVKECLEIKREELSENTILIDKLNDELICANKELETFKLKPLEVESKGNSLFAEVDDRRVHLQKTINDMKSGYVHLKQEHLQNVKLIAQLRKENVDLRESWKKDLEQIQEDDYWVSDTLKRHVKVLEDIIEEQKKQIEENSNLSGDVLSRESQFYLQMINDKSKEIEQWKKKLTDKSISEHLLSVNLAQANKKVRLLRLELQQQEEKIKAANSQEAVPVIREISCQKCKNYTDERRQTRYFVKDHKEKPCEESERKPIKSCLKQQEALPDNDVTLEYAAVYVQKEGDFNIFQNEISHKRKGQTLQLDSDIHDPNEISETHRTESKEEPDKENVDTNEQNVKERKGVTFTENTIDPVSNPVRRRGTRIFIVNKKSDLDSTQN